MTASCAECIRELFPWMALSTHCFSAPKTSPSTWMAKYRLLRAFFDFWLACGEIGALPMPVKRKATQQPFVPYIYAHSEIRNLLKAVPGCQKAVRCAIDPITLRAFLIFMYATGALVGEALRLSIEDVDLKKGSVTIRRNRYNRSRSIPIGRDLINLLKDYSVFRRRQVTTDRSFFLNKEREALNKATIERTFERLRRVSGICRHDGASFQPRMSDLRHTFAVHRITGWIKHGADLTVCCRRYRSIWGWRGSERPKNTCVLRPSAFVLSSSN